MALEIFVRSTVNLPGLRAGKYAWVDPERERIYIEAGYLEPVAEVPSRSAVIVEEERDAHD